MDNTETIYHRIGVRPLVNAAGRRTREGGPLMDPIVADAIREAADSGAHISDLQAEASRRIAEATGADAGHVVSGASAGITMAAAACIAGESFELIERMPNVGEAPNEIIVPHAHKNKYDHGLRVGGASITYVGSAGNYLWPTIPNLTLREINEAINEETVGLFWVPTPRNTLELSEVVDVAHGHEVPVIVDAAGTLPPRSNLTRFVDAGADLVVFSGGKGIQGPQSTGFIAGREDLIRSVIFQHLDMSAPLTERMPDPFWDPPWSFVNPDDMGGVPRSGMGRGFKVDKEGLVGAIVALETFLKADMEAYISKLEQRIDRIASELKKIDRFQVETIPPECSEQEATYPQEMIPLLKVTLGDADRASSLVRSLLSYDPKVFVLRYDVEDGSVWINPISIGDHQIKQLVAGFKAWIN